MYYFNHKKDIVEKYLVSFNKEEIEALRTEIINNCSEIEHKEYDGCSGPNYFDYLKIRNYKEKYIGIKESRDTLQMPDQKIYHYSYDEYKFPKLISLIDELLKENIEVLNKIFNYVSIYKTDTIEERIRIASDQLDAINNLEFDKKRKKLDELQKLVELKKININQKPIYQYYIKLKELIKLELVDTISKEEIKRFRDFFENDNSLYKENDKILKKDL